MVRGTSSSCEKSDQSTIDAGLNHDASKRATVAYDLCGGSIGETAVTTRMAPTTRRCRSLLRPRNRHPNRWLLPPLPSPGCPPLRGFGRIPVHNVRPEVESGHLPIYSVVDEEFEVTANVFREGHDAVGASVVLTDPEGNRHLTDMHQVEPWGLDIWKARVSADIEGDWTMHIEGWSDTWGTWHHNANAKLAAAIDVELVCAEGHALINEAVRHAEQSGDTDAITALRETDANLTPDRAPDSLQQVINTYAFCEAMRVHAPRLLTSPTLPAPLRVERRRALYGSWYEFFPRSQGAYVDADGHWVSGTFDTSWERLDAAAAMGFDVVYLPPIHPIGTAFRKGKNNTLNPGPDDPGSPWAIGSSDGGHDTIHPDLGTFDDLDRFVAHAHDLGMEVALDFALQASPDHPWVHQHPEWFTTRVDGTIAYAENPPKKYQDIYPINFDNDPDGIYQECLRLLELSSKNRLIRLVCRTLRTSLSPRWVTTSSAARPWSRPSTTTPTVPTRGTTWVAT